MAETYFELLRRAEWQKKRLLIMERDGFSCRECGDESTTLNVHHSYYTKGAKPWEYPDESLACLCEPCHKSRHELVEELKATFAPLDNAAILQVLGYAKGLSLQYGVERITIESQSDACGLADSHGLDTCAVFALSKAGSVNSDLMTELFIKQSRAEVPT